MRAPRIAPVVLVLVAGLLLGCPKGKAPDDAQIRRIITETAEFTQAVAGVALGDLEQCDELIVEAAALTDAITDVATDNADKIAQISRITSIVAMAGQFGCPIVIQTFAPSEI